MTSPGLHICANTDSRILASYMECIPVHTMQYIKTAVLQDDGQASLLSQLSVTNTSLPTLPTYSKHLLSTATHGAVLKGSLSRMHGTSWCIDISQGLGRINVMEGCLFTHAHSRPSKYVTVPV